MCGRQIDTEAIVESSGKALTVSRADIIARGNSMNGLHRPHKPGKLRRSLNTVIAVLAALATISGVASLTVE